MKLFIDGKHETLYCELNFSSYLSNTIPILHEAKIELDTFPE
jgi:hypothetical protein